MVKEKWFHPRRHSGFKESRGVQANYRVMMRNAPKNWGVRAKRRLVLRQAIALANVTQDVGTRRKARAVARLASRMLKTKYPHRTR